MSTVPRAGIIYLPGASFTLKKNHEIDKKITQAPLCF